MPPRQGWSVAWHRRGLGAGAAYAVAQVTQVSSFPLAQEVVRQLENLYTSFRAPERNNLDAQSLMNNIGAVIHAMDSADDELKDVLGGDDNETIFKELARFYVKLATALAQLRDDQRHGHTHRLLHHERLQEQVEQTRRELMDTTCSLAFRLGLLAFAQAGHSRHAFAQLQREVVAKHGEMVHEIRSLAKRSDTTIVLSVSIVLFE